MAGKLIILSAPSGSGKTTILKKLLDKDFNLEFSISATSRKPRGKEEHGKDYYFLSVDDFKNKIKNDAFLEWEEVYENNYYGTLRSEIERIANNGNNVVFDVDVVGGVNIKKQYQENALSIFVKPPSVEELEKRLRGRATDTEEVIQKRLDKANYELTFADKFDEVIVNDNLEKAVEQTTEVLNRFLNNR